MLLTAKCMEVVGRCRDVHHLPVGLLDLVSAKVILKGWNIIFIIVTQLKEIAPVGMTNVQHLVPCNREVAALQARSAAAIYVLLQKRTDQS